MIGHRPGDINSIIRSVKCVVAWSVGRAARYISVHAGIPAPIVVRIAGTAGHRVTIDVDASALWVSVRDVAHGFGVS